MAIKIKDLEQLASQYTTNNYVYKDLSLDLQKSSIVAPGYSIPDPGLDIKASFDLEAISNSLTNLFNTDRGQRFLFPEYGVSLKKFIFSPITQNNGESIGRTIYNGIKKYEPRIVPISVDVVGVPDEYIYRVEVLVEYPAFNKKTALNFILDIRKESFISLPVKNQ